MASISRMTLVAVSSLPSGPEGADVTDARAALAAHVFHGIGEDPLASDLWRDKANANLVVGARSEATMDALRQIVADERNLSSRLQELEQAGLLRCRGDRVEATFPILVGRERDLYEELASAAADSIEKRERTGWEDLLQDLRSRGWADWSYHFIWSETMDSGFSWSPMMKWGHVPPLSRFVVWVVYPPHAYASGTNYYPNTELRDQLLAVTWRDRARSPISRVGTEWQAVWSAAATGKPTPDEAERLRALGLMDKTGRVLVPLVTKADPLYAKMQSLGEQHVRLVAEHLPLDRLASLARVSQQVAFAMAYHDVSWDILRRMVDRGLLAVPPALKEGAGENTSMAGTCAVAEAHPGFVSEIRKALGIPQ